MVVFYVEQAVGVIILVILVMSTPDKPWFMTVMISYLNYLPNYKQPRAL